MTRTLTVARDRDTAMLTTRSFVADLVSCAVTERYDEIDLSQLAVISRAAADELLTACDARDITLTGADGEVAEMLSTVRASRGETDA